MEPVLALAHSFSALLQHDLRHSLCMSNSMNYLLNFIQWQPVSLILWQLLPVLWVPPISTTLWLSCVVFPSCGLVISLLFGFFFPFPFVLSLSPIVIFLDPFTLDSPFVSHSAFSISIPVTGNVNCMSLLSSWSHTRKGEDKGRSRSAWVQPCSCSRGLRCVTPAGVNAGHDCLNERISDANEKHMLETNRPEKYGEMPISEKHWIIAFLLFWWPSHT